MNCKEILNVTFSPSSTTQQCCDAIAKAMGLPVKNLPLLTQPLTEALSVSADTLVLVGMPVYGGRIPPRYAEMLRLISAKGCPAVAVAVYGNRDYDDALLEIADILAEDGATVLAAGAFIGRHSLFRKVADGRPDEKDHALLAEFGKKSLELVSAWNGGAAAISIKGNKPYKELGGGKSPIMVVTDGDKCIDCGQCAAICPTKAIPADDFRTTDMDKCMRCGACLTVCPMDARRFDCEGFDAMAAGFGEKCAAYRTPEMFYATL